MKSNRFWKCLREYFVVYLPKQKNASEKTIIACRTSWNLFLRFLIQEKGLQTKSLEFEQFSSKMLLEFLDYMEEKKGWQASTRNQRLSCIRSFFKYASYVEPVTYAVYVDLLTVPLKKGVDKSCILNYMSKEEVATLIASADVHSPKEFRNRFFMTMMYDTAARCGEMLNLRLDDLDPEKGTVYLMGKGRKPRVVPISAETIAMYKEYITLFHRDGDWKNPLFYVMHKGEKSVMSEDNVARFIKQYAEKARNENKSMPQRIHPHMFRHSRAMHLYQGGMPLAMLSELLGHANPETTLIYAHADTEMKREAIQRASAGVYTYVSVDEPPIWEDTDILERLIRGY